MGADVEDFELVGRGPEGIGEPFQSGSAGGVAFWGRDVVPEPPYGAGPEKLLAQGHAKDHWEAVKATGGGELRLYSDGGRNGGIVLQGYRGLHYEEAEYSRAIYCDATDSGPL